MPPLIKRHCLSILVTNEPGVLARVVGLFSGRGYNIDSLSVAEVDPDAHLSRITVVTSGTDDIVAQIQAQVGRLVPVRHVANLGSAGEWVELVLAALAPKDHAAREEALRLASRHGAQALDSGAVRLRFHKTGASESVDAFLAALRGLGALDVARTGPIGL